MNDTPPCPSCDQGWGEYSHDISTGEVYVCTSCGVVFVVRFSDDDDERHA